MAAPLKTRLTSFEDILAKKLENPGFREKWERLALARAVAHWIITYRARNNLSQAQLAAMLGLKQPHITRLENAEHEPLLSTLRLLSDRLGMELQIQFTPPPQPSTAAGEQVRTLVPFASEDEFGSGGRVRFATRKPSARKRVLASAGG
jgi:transcriptional regulator with XRE-family HTH domain